MKVLCDTNILIEYYKANENILQSLRQIGVNNIAVSVIVEAELFYGAKDKRELNLIKRHLSLCYCYPIDERVSLLFSELMQQYALSHRASIPDMLIAATAIIYDVPLFTLNLKDFQFIPKIKLYKVR